VRFSISTALLIATAAAPASALTYTAGNQPNPEISVDEFATSRFVASGVSNGFRWEARNTIVGQTPTSDVLPPSNTIGGGDPIYKPTANKSGTVSLIMEYRSGARFICSGSVIDGGNSIATAAHCVSGGGGIKDPDLVKTTAYFFKGDPDERTPFQTGGVEIDIKHYFVNPEYTGEVVDQNDIAILRLETPAPVSAEVYELYTPASLRGTQFNVAGYGARSTVGGNAGTSTAAVAGRTGFLREGDNIYDYAWGDAVFNGFFTDIVGGTQFFDGVAEIESSYLSDFDNGLAAQSMSFRICAAVSGPGACAPFINNGLGAREVGIAGGDSGGPGFVDGKLASINSYGLTFGTAFGDILGAVAPPAGSGSALNNSFGEYSGYVPIYIHKDWISSVVPEPASWAMMIGGFGLVGASMRRRRKVVAA
jgi:hypothetical protein